MEKFIFAIYDNIAKENIIPNGFAMSVDEFERHRLKVGGKSNVKFKIEHMIIDQKKIIPIHKNTFKANKEFFKQNGELLYFICLNRDFDHYLEFFQAGMNFWLNFIDDDTVEILSKDKIKLVIVCSLEILPLKQVFQFIQSTDRVINKKIQYEIWTPFTLPTKNKKLLGSIVKELLKDEWQYKDMSESQILGRHVREINRFTEVVKDFPYWEDYVLRNCKSNNLTLEKTKRYICLCRRYTDERLLTHSYIVSNNLLDLGFNSIPATDTVIESRNLVQITTNLAYKYPSFQNEIEKTLEYWKTNPSGIVLDQEPIKDTQRTIYSRDYNGFANPPDLEKYYAQSYLSLVCEGDTKLGTFMLTEKIYRSIFYKHMFIIIGSCGILESLREKGYQTFETLWPEEYDYIIDDVERWKAALDLFKEIATWKKIGNLYERALPIIEHNYKNMISRVEKFKTQFN